MAAGDGGDIAAEQHVLHAPVRAGVADVVAELLRRIPAGLRSGDGFHRFDLHGEAVARFVFDQRLERGASAARVTSR